MTNITNILGLIGVGVIGGIILNYDRIKIEVLKQKGVFQARNITINFFRQEIKNNPNITLNEAILKFEDTQNKFKSLEDFCKERNRPITSYTKAYSKLFEIAKII